MSQPTYAKGLEGVIADESKICYIDGEAGLLSYRGYSIVDLAKNSNFGETAWLLLFGKLPTQTELDAFNERLTAARKLDPVVINVLKALPKSTHPMVALQTAVAAHGSLSSVEGGPGKENVDRAIDLIGAVPTMVAAWARLRTGKDVIDPRPELGHGQNFLYMINGEAPDDETGHIFDICLILHMEHSFNASTFSGRVVASTLAPLDASVSAAVGALYGPLHGGANEAVLKMLEEVPSAKEAPAWLDKALAEKRKIMGMGHRVYRAKDPRSIVLEKYLKRLAEKKGDTSKYDTLKAIENHMAEVMEAKGKKIYPNVDFFSGSLYNLLGIEPSEFTPIFAVARVVGWVSHIIEQWEDNRIFRPKALYVGESDLKWKPINER